MGQAASTYAACGDTFEEACQNLQMLMRFYVDDRFIVQWKHYLDPNTQEWRRQKVAMAGKRIYIVNCERNHVNQLVSAIVVL